MPQQQKTAPPKERPGKPRRRQARMPKDGSDMRKFELANRDVYFHYVLAEQGGNVGSQHSREMYEEAGYKVAIAEDGGVNWRRAPVKKGQPILRDGFILMMIPMQDDEADMDYAALNEYGRDGQSGQESLDARENFVQQGIVPGLDLRNPGEHLTPDIKISPFVRES